MGKVQGNLEENYYTIATCVLYGIGTKVVMELLHMHESGPSDVELQISSIAVADRFNRQWICADRIIEIWAEVMDVTGKVGDPLA